MLPKEIDQPVIHAKLSPPCEVDNAQAGTKVSILGKLNAILVKPPMFRGNTSLVLVQSRSNDINALGFLPQPRHIRPPIEVRIEIDHTIDIRKEFRKQKPCINHPVPVVWTKATERINRHGDSVDANI